MPRGAAVIKYEGQRGTVWRIKYTDATGKQVQETLGREADGWTRKKAESELRARLVAVEKSGYVKPEAISFRAVSERWATQEATRKNWRASTVSAYSIVTARLNETFGTMPVASIRPRHVSDYVNDALGDLGPATVSRDLSVLHAILGWAMRHELTDRNAAQGVPHPRQVQRRGIALTPEQVKLLLRNFDDEQARVAFLTFVLTGIRRFELQALRWRDIDFIENKITIVDSKTETGRRVIAMPKMLHEALWAHRRASKFQGDDERAFCHPEIGSLYRAEKFREALRATFKRAGLEVPEGLRWCHDLRVTSITNDAIAGANPIAVMAKAGHANMSTTKRYLKLAGIVFRDEADALEARMFGTATPNLVPEVVPTSDAPTATASV